jgi:hypothetical protein
VADRRRPLHAQVRTDWRRQALEPVGLPCGVVAVDHQTRWTGPVAHAHDPHAQVVHQQERPAYAQVRAVRTVWLSAGSKPAIAQVAIRANTHEGGMCPEVLHVLEATYGALMESYRLEAGFGSPAQARLMAAAHNGSISGLKGHQPEWWREAERVLGAQTTAEESRAWEPSQGDQLRDQLERTTAMEASLDWSHLKQVWRVEKEMRQGKTGQVAGETRDEVTTRHRGRLRPEPILAVVRAPGAIANHGHGTVEVIWDEARQVWGGPDVGLQVLG